MLVSESADTQSQIAALRPGVIHHQSRISSFWRSKSGKVYFRMYGLDLPVLIGAGVKEDLIPFLAKNLGAWIKAEDKGEYFLAVNFGITARVYLRDKSGQPVEWEQRELPYQWKQVARPVRRRRKWLSESDYNGQYEPIR